MKRGEVRGNLWSIVLAGGDGVRTKEFTRHGLRSEIPGPYCAFVGSRSLFQHTLDRAARLTPWDRVVVVAARHHQQKVWPQLDGRPVGRVLLPPKNVDTAAGIFLPLTYILARDPQATVVMYPSDYFLSEEGPVLSAMDHAVRGRSRLEGRWSIKPGQFLARTGKAAIQAMETCFEHPEEASAHETRSTGSLWNTMVLAATGEELWGLGWQCFPEMMSHFERLKEVIDTAEEPMVLGAIYEAMLRRNISSPLLHFTTERLPGRIVDTLDKTGKPMTCAEEPLPFLYQG